MQIHDDYVLLVCLLPESEWDYKAEPLFLGW